MASPDTIMLLIVDQALGQDPVAPLAYAAEWYYVSSSDLTGVLYVEFQFQFHFLQCSDTVGWATGTASGL